MIGPVLGFRRLSAAFGPFAPPDCVISILSRRLFFHFDVAWPFVSSELVLVSFELSVFDCDFVF